jgi:hypothetical protein
MSHKAYGMKKRGRGASGLEFAELRFPQAFRVPECRRLNRGQAHFAADPQRLMVAVATLNGLCLLTRSCNFVTFPVTAICGHHAAHRLWSLSGLVLISRSACHVCTLACALRCLNDVSHLISVACVLIAYVRCLFAYLNTTMHTACTARG